jgi:hypothetical protein
VGAILVPVPTCLSELLVVVLDQGQVHHAWMSNYLKLVYASDEPQSFRFVAR